MKVINQTNFDTRYLRRLFIACEKHEGTDHKYRQVKVRYTRRSRVHGYAWYNSNSVVMQINRQGIGTRKLAQIYIHEVGHNLGLLHKEMMHYSRIDVSWLPDEEIPLKKVKPSKPKLSIVEVRAQKAQKKLVEWQGKFKRAKTAVKKYQTKVRYYEKKAAAVSQKKEERINDR